MNAAAESKQDGDAPPVHEWRFPVALGLLVLLTVVLFRILGGAGFGFHGVAADGRVPLGIVYNSHDSLMYLSWTRQAAEGYCLFEDRYALEQHPRAFFNPYFLVAGHVARWLAVTPQGILILPGLAAIPVLIVAAYAIARRVGLSVAEARCAVILVAFASGITYPLVWFGEVCGVPFWLPGADKDYLDALFFPTFLVYPYITVAYALMALTILVALSCDRAELAPRQRTVRLVALFLMTLVLGFTHPYEHAMLLVSYTGFVAWTGCTPTTRPFVGRRLLILAALALGSGTVVGYFFWLSLQPVWSYVAQVSARVPFDPIIWGLGYGMLLPLAFWGGGISGKRPAQERTRWLIVWLAVLIVLLIVLNIEQTKVSSGGHLPFCILGGVTLANLAERVAALKNTAQRGLATAGLAVIWATLFGSTIGLLIDKFGDDYRVDADLLAVAGHIEVVDEAARPRVVCDMDTADVLVSLFGVRTYCGNHYKTPDFFVKRQVQCDAGVEPWAGPGRYDAVRRRAELRQLLTRERIDYLLLERSAAAASDIGVIDGLERVSAQGEWLLYRVKK